MDENTLKLKRQVRDHYNKHVTDETIIEKVAKIIGYRRRDEQKHND